MLKSQSLVNVNKAQNAALWILRVLVAGMFLMAGASKLGGTPLMVAMFAKIGLGQWFRILTGSLEVIGAIGLLTPRLAGLAALLLTGVMTGAVLTHLFILGGNPAPAVVLLILSAVIAWARRQDVRAVLEMVT